MARVIGWGKSIMNGRIGELWSMCVDKAEAGGEEEKVVRYVECHHLEPALTSS